MTMLKYFSLTLLFTFVLFANQYGQDENPIRSFEVKLGNNRYLLYEPVVVNFDARLLTGDPKPAFIHDTTVRVFFGSEIRDMGALAANTDAPQRLPEIYRPVLPGVEPSSTTAYRGTSIIDRTKEIFPEPGNYQVQFILHVSGQEIPSNIVTVAIEPPTGIDKKAFEYLNKFKGNVSFDWVWKEKAGLQTLESFTEKYRGSAYSEYGIQFLGNIFLARNDLDRARYQFEKLTISNNKLLSTSAAEALNEIEKRKLAKEAPEQP